MNPPKFTSSRDRTCWFTAFLTRRRRSKSPCRALLFLRRLGHAVPSAGRRSDLDGFGGLRCWCKTFHGLLNRRERLRIQMGGDLIALAGSLFVPLGGGQAD